ncbi:MAG TPA: tetratricopeptide repeat protein [Pseudolabrys sp.]|nr:tetratricopeptide repeat protein [Pseudolabrys sp.]
MIAAASVALLSGSAYAQTPSPAPAPSQTAPGTPNENKRVPDIAYGAYQRGYFLTAFADATHLAEHNDPQSMTLLGELYANGQGVGRDDAKAESWYKLAADRGDRNAIFALAMFRFEGRNGPRNVEAGAKLLERAVKLGHPAAAYDLGLLYMQGQGVQQDLKHAVALFTFAAKAGNAEAEYALATMYKDGRGVAKNQVEATRLMGRAALAGKVEAMVEFGIAQFNGEGIPKNEAAAAHLILLAAQHGNPIAQNRMAHILSAGRGMKADPVDAVKWHLIARASGKGDPDLDIYVAKQTAAVRAAAGKKVKLWFSTAPKKP